VRIKQCIADINYSTWAEACDSDPKMGGSNNVTNISTDQLGQELATLCLGIVGGSSNSTKMLTIQLGRKLATLML
jgi:hypothetical protein